MQRGRIFLIGQEENRLIPMDETPYPSEDILQVLLANYPDLLPGDQISPENARRWFLISREVDVPGDIDEAGRWSLDHLFLDQDGIPTFVECKRAADTRSRREVVAQMLDYAANGIEYWAIDRLRQAATETARSRNRSLDQEILSLIGTEDEAEIERFWQQVENNLRAGKVRLIFVADSTSKELRRLVEFLNDKMSDVEVLAVEIKQFLGGDNQKALVSRVVGLTESARVNKTENRAKRQTNCSEFLAKCTPNAVPLFERILDLASQRGHTINWGEVGFSIRALVPKNNQFISFHRMTFNSISVICHSAKRSNKHYGHA
jgi:ribosomal protein L7Ae-like RNA K-turn-binding protein